MEEKLSASPIPDGIEEFIKTIPARNGANISLRIHRSKNDSVQSPLIVYYHFGGYCVGGSALAIPLCRDLVTVSTPYNNLSPPLTGQFLSLPSCLPPEIVPEKYKSLYHSWEQAKQAPKLFGYEMTVVFRKAHAPDMNSPLFGAFNDPRGHSGMPPAYFQIFGLDPVRDEGLVHEKVLREEYGVETKLDLYRGFPHAFRQVCPAFEKGRQAHEDMLGGFAWLLEKKP